MITRRNFIRSLLYTGLVTSSWTSVNAAITPENETFAHTSEEIGLSNEFLSNREAVKKVVRGYLETNPDEASTSLLLKRLGIPNVVENDSEQKRHLAELRQRDFETADVLFVDGWMISRTEARLCVLATKWQI